jgi:hypothetical protein
MSTASTTAAVTDPGTALAVVLAIASGFFTVGAFYYFRITAAAERLAIRRLRKRLRHSARLAELGRFGSLLALFDAVSAVGIRLSVGLPLALIWLLLVPLFLTVGSIALAV